MKITKTHVPHVTFLNQKDSNWEKIKSEDFFKGKKIILFGLPGAFTPTCSFLQLPRYELLTPYFKRKGIDEVVCISVNDGFVMEAWGRDQGLEQVKLLADGNGDFTRELGLLVDKKSLGFGDRSWRYSIYIEDGEIKEAFIEPDKPGDPFEVSDADTMYQKLFSEKAPAVATIFTKKGCHFCKEAKKLLTDNEIIFEEIVMQNGSFSLNAIKNITGKALVPRVYFDDKLIGGLLELRKALSE